MVAASHRQRFERDGYLVLPGFVPKAECAGLRARMAELVVGFEPGGVGSIFSTTGEQHAQDRYFLEFGRPDPVLLRGGGVRRRPARLRQSKERSINKVGHALHDLDPVFDRVLAPAGAGRGWSASWASPSRCCSSRCTSSSSRGSAARSSATRTRPSSTPSRRACIGLWFALEDATLENGCLYARAGRPSRAAAQRASAARACGTETVVLDPTPLPSDGPGAARGRRRARSSCCTGSCRTGARRTARRARATPTRCT